MTQSLKLNSRAKGLFPPFSSFSSSYFALSFPTERKHRRCRSRFQQPVHMFDANEMTRKEMRRFRAFSPTLSKLFTLASPKTKMAAVALLSTEAAAEGEYSGAQSRIATATVGRGGSSCSAAARGRRGRICWRRTGRGSRTTAAGRRQLLPSAVPTRTRLRRRRRRRRQPMRGLSPSRSRSPSLSLGRPTESARRPPAARPRSSRSVRAPPPPIARPTRPPARAGGSSPPCAPAARSALSPQAASLASAGPARARLSRATWSGGARRRRRTKEGTASRRETGKPAWPAAG